VRRPSSGNVYGACNVPLKIRGIWAGLVFGLKSEIVCSPLRENTCRLSSNRKRFATRRQSGNGELLSKARAKLIADLFGKEVGATPNTSGSFVYQLLPAIPH